MKVSFRLALRRLAATVGYGCLFAYALSIVWVLLYTVIPPPLTPLMVQRLLEGLFRGEWTGISYRWTPARELPPVLFRALIAAEDARFASHFGFDWRAIEQARRRNERLRGRRLYGASTISMQTAKNTFLLPARTHIRKALEAYFTVLIEAFWGKKRIAEVYANIIEWGNGIYGIGAAAQHYFGKTPRELTAREAALLAAVLPNPRRWSPAAPTPYILRRSSWIRARMVVVALPR